MVQLYNSITLEKLDDGSKTLLKLVQDGFKNLPVEIQEEVHQRYMRYWEQSGIMERFETLLANSISQPDRGTRSNGI